MDFRRNGLREERRRRVLIDETLHAADSSDASNIDASTPDVARSPTKPYSDAALASSQTPVTFFLPKRPFIMWTVWLIGMSFIAGIELLYHYVYLAVSGPLQGSLSAFDVVARGSLASWFAGVVLAVSAFAALLVYQIRRHRTDDYRGRYRWWLWLVPLLLLLSVSATTGCHEVLSGVLTAVTGAEVAVGGKGWWMLAYGAVFFPIALQVAIEVWQSRMATIFLVMTVAAYGTVAAFELGALQLAQPQFTTICHSAVLLAAHLGILVTLLAYGRYVYLEAHDELATRKKWLRWPKQRRKATDKTPVAAKKTTRKAKQVRVDEPHEKFGDEKSSPPAVTLKADVREYDEEDDLEIGAGRKLSKADRRRLRKDAQRS